MVNKIRFMLLYHIIYFSEDMSKQFKDFVIKYFYFITLIAHAAATELYGPSFAQ